MLHRYSEEAKYTPHQLDQCAVCWIDGPAALAASGKQKNQRSKNQMFKGLTWSSPIYPSVRTSEVSF